MFSVSSVVRTIEVGIYWKLLAVNGDFLSLLLLLVTFVTLGDFCYFGGLMLLLVTFVTFGDFVTFFVTFDFCFVSFVL